MTPFAMSHTGRTLSRGMSTAFKFVKTSLIVSSASMGAIGVCVGAGVGWKEALYGQAPWSYPTPKEAFLMTPIKMLTAGLAGGVIGAAVGAMPFVAFPAAYRAYVLNRNEKQRDRDERKGRGAERRD